MPPRTASLSEAPLFVLRIEPAHQVVHLERCPVVAKQPLDFSFLAVLSRNDTDEPEQHVQRLVEEHCWRPPSGQQLITLSLLRQWLQLSRTMLYRLCGTARAWRKHLGVKAGRTWTVIAKEAVFRSVVARAAALTVLMARHPNHPNQPKGHARLASPSMWNAITGQPAPERTQPQCPRSYGSAEQARSTKCAKVLSSGCSRASAGYASGGTWLKAQKTIVLENF